MARKKNNRGSNRGNSKLVRSESQEDDMAGASPKINPNEEKLKKTVQVYLTKFDAKLEEMLDEFDNFDYRHKPLLTQSEFEEEFLVILSKLLRRSNKYELIHCIFKTLVENSLNDLHKLLCLIDFMINISNYDPSVFKKLPNEIVGSVSKKPLFSKIEEYIYNRGRMNYPFKSFNKSLILSKSKDQGQDRRETHHEENTPLFNYDSDESEEVDQADIANQRKSMNVSLAELTKKIMSKSKQVTKETMDYDLIKKEESDDDAFLIANYESDESDDDDLMPPPASNDSDDEEYTDSAAEQLTKKKKLLSKEAQLEDMVRSDSDYFSAEEASGHEPQSDINMENLNTQMDSTTSILEHNFDYQALSGALSATTLQSLKKIGQKPKSRKVKQKQTEKKQKAIASRETKSRKPRSPVKRKTYYVLEKDLDFLYLEIERRLPKIQSTLLKSESKGFVYKPAQYSLFANLSSEQTDMDDSVKKSTDNLINSFVFQTYKKSGGCALDRTQIIHPLEYSYVMENLERLKESGKKLAPIVFIDRFSSLLDYDGNINEKIDPLRIKNTKVKGLINLKLFNSEDEYFEKFKKVVPRDKVAARLKYMNRLVTDGKSLYIFDLCDEIVQAMESAPQLNYDSEEEEEKQKETATLEKLRAERLNFAEDQEEATDTNTAFNLRSQNKGELLKDIDNPENEDAVHTDDTSDSKNSSANKVHNSSGLNGVMPTTEAESSKDDEGIPPHEDSTNRLPTSNGVVKIPEEIEAITAQTSNSPESLHETSSPQEIGKHLEESQNGVTPLTQEQPYTESSNDALNEESTSISAPDLAVNKENRNSDDENAKLNMIPGTASEKDSTQSQEPPAVLKKDSENPRQAKTLVPAARTKQKLDEIKDDRREAVYCSAKGINIPCSSVQKVLSTEEYFVLLSLVMFPTLKIETKFEGLHPHFLKCLGQAYNAFRPYLMSLFAEDVINFNNHPNFFKVDSVLFELQLQEAIKSFQVVSSRKYK